VQVSLVIGSTEADHLSIVVLGRSHPDAADFWDGNWIRSALEVRAGGFTGHVVAQLRAEEIGRFTEGLQSLNDNLAGSAVLQSMEDWITLSITCHPNGALDVSGELTDAPGTGNRLEFELNGFDQTHLPSWLSQLTAINESFPPLG
jgi:hypothetical protein